MTKINEAGLEAAVAASASSCSDRDSLRDAITAYLAATAPKKVPADYEPIPFGYDDYAAMTEADLTKETGIARDGLESLVILAHGASWKAGWHTDPATGEPKERNRGEMLMLIVSEVAEGLEGERKSLMDDHLPERPMAEVECADAVIRLADYCGRWGYDLAGAVIDKMAYNAVREDHKLETRAAGGKAF